MQQVKSQNTYLAEKDLPQGWNVFDSKKLKNIFEWICGNLGYKLTVPKLFNVTPPNEQLVHKFQEQFDFSDFST